MAYSEPIVETWALYGAGSLLIFLRILCRWRHVGFRNFDPDDYLVGFSWVRLSPEQSPPPLAGQWLMVLRTTDGLHGDVGVTSPSSAECHQSSYSKMEEPGLWASNMLMFPLQDLRRRRL